MSKALLRATLRSPTQRTHCDGTLEKRKRSPLVSCLSILGMWCLNRTLGHQPAVSSCRLLVNGESVVWWGCKHF
jgi:hypothetical protein